MALSRVRRCCTGSRVARPLLVLAILLSAAFVPAAVAAPPNDAFVDAAVLTGLPVAVDASNVGASSEPDEPLVYWRDPPSGSPNSVWWRWTARESGPVAVQACSIRRDLQSSGGPTVAVYEGDALSSLRHVGSSASSLFPPACPENEFSDRVAFLALPGRRYSIEVDSYFTGGQFRLEIIRAGSLARSTVRVRGERRARVVYRAAPGELNSEFFYLDWDPGEELIPELPVPPSPPVSFWADSLLAVSPGQGCPASVRQRVTECPIPSGLLQAGPLIALGDGNDFLEVNYSRPGTVVFGGEGNDKITAGGRVSGGPGADEITARTWGRSRINGGPGNDSITGSRRSNVIDPGPGIDVVSSGGGRDVVRTRDGEIDHVECEGTAYIDGLDEADCTRVHRRGAARAIPAEPAISIDPSSSDNWISLSCPRDAPRVCAGTVIVSRHDRVFLRLPFRIRRLDPEYGELEDVNFRVSQRKARAMEGNVRITVDSRDRAGKRRTASGIYNLAIY